MAATLDPAAGDANSDTETTESRHIVLVGEIGKLKSLDTRAHFDGWSRPA